MKLAIRVVCYVLALISVAAGVAKLFRAPQEVTFFADAGLGVTPLVLLGLLQVTGGALVFIGRTAKVGLVLVTIGFAVSVLVILMTGNIVFAVVSMLPVLLGLGSFVYKNA